MGRIANRVPGGRQRPAGSDREAVLSSTLFDKLWDSHCIESDEHGEDLLYIDRLCLHERTGGIALNALLEAGRPVRRAEHAFCMMDHILDTRPGRTDRTLVPGGEQFIARSRSGAAALGVRVFDVNDPQQGISHAVSAEQGIALPGLSIVCPDSHTCTLGALGALAFGIGTSETEHVLATSTLRMARPPNMRVTVQGALPEYVTAKDLALYLIAEHGAAGGSGAAVEFDGEAIAALDIEGRMTLCNMAVEFAAATAVIAPDQAVLDYVAGRPFAPFPLPSAEWQALKSDPNARFDRNLDIDARQVSHRVTWGTSPEQGVELQGRVPEPKDRNERQALAYADLAPGTPMTDISIDAAFIGSCTNARLGDLRAAAKVLEGRRVAPGVAAVCAPASTPIKRAAEAEGLDAVFRAAGFEWRESGCSMCFYAGGETFGPGRRVISTTNRNFEGRQGPGTRTHLASPAVVAASALRGRISAPEPR